MRRLGVDLLHLLILVHDDLEADESTADGEGNASDTNQSEDYE